MAYRESRVKLYLLQCSRETDDNYFIMEKVKHTSYLHMDFLCPYIKNKKKKDI